MKNRGLSAPVAASLALGLLGTSCGPGDAPFRVVVRGVDVVLKNPASGKLLAWPACDFPGGAKLQLDLGLMAPNSPSMMSTPHNLHFEPGSQGGFQVFRTVNSNGEVAMRIVGHRPQELRFQPGRAIIAITGTVTCPAPNIDVAPSVYPFAYYSEPRDLVPGREIVVQGNAAVGDALACGTRSGTGLAPPDNVSIFQLISPTAPSLSGSYRCASNTSSRFGPVPKQGKYILKYTDSSLGTALEKCAIYELGGGETDPVSPTREGACTALGTPAIAP